MSPHPTPLRRPGMLMAGAALLESLCIPLIIDLLLFGLVVRGAPLWRLIACAIPASALGTLAWYGAGLLWGQDAVAWATTSFAIGPEAQAQAATAWDTHWPWALFMASLTAVPDPLMAGLAGARGAPLGPVLTIILASHTLRFILMGVVIALAARLARATPTPMRTWATRLSITTSLAIGLVMGAVVLGRAWG